jgi:hypothetical protein
MFPTLSNEEQTFVISCIDNFYNNIWLAQHKWLPMTTNDNKWQQMTTNDYICPLLITNDD